MFKMMPLFMEHNTSDFQKKSEKGIACSQFQRLQWAVYLSEAMEGFTWYKTDAHSGARIIRNNV